MAFRKKLASAAFGALRSTGVFSLAARLPRRQQRLLILCYHGLSLDDEHRWLPQLYFTPDQFRQRLSTLKGAGAHVLPFAEAFSRLQNGTLPPRSVALTFDDGFYDFGYHGVPILAEFGMQATLYLTTHYSGHRFPIITLILDYLLWKSNRPSLLWPEKDIPAPLPLGNYGQRQVVVLHLLRWMEHNHLSTAAKNEVACALAERCGIDYQAILRRRILQVLRPDEVCRVAQAGIDIQLHTHRHRTPLDRALFVQELQDNGRKIAEFTGKQPEHFCYPSGNYSPRFLPWLVECGVKSAVTCNPGLANQGSSPLKLPRVLDHGEFGALRFQSAIAGLVV